MKKKIKVWYDKEGDFLELQFGSSTGVVRPLGNDCFELLDKKENVVGFAIFNFTKRFKKHEEVILPINL